MKTIFYLKQFLAPAFLALILCLCNTGFTQNATRSLPSGIGRNCGAGTGTTNASDSVKVFNFNDATNQLTQLYSCRPSLQSPGFSPYSGSITFNPQDQKLYYIETTNGVNSYIYRWLPNSCPASSFTYSYSYTNRYIVGLDFDPVSGNGYQLEFNGSTAPYVISIRKVNFGTGTFGPSDTLLLPAGKNIYQQSGDIVFTPLGQLYFAFDNKLFQVDYSNYGPGVKLNTAFIDTLALGNTLLGLSYAHGKFIAACQNGSNSSCQFKEIDISTGSAVISPLSLPTGSVYTGTDLATIITGIGVAKKVAAVSWLGTNNYLVEYDVKVKNFGNTTLTNVQVTDSVKKVFGAAFTSSYLSVVGSLPSGLTLNSSYNGNTNCNLFAGGAGSILNASPIDSAVVRVSVVLNNPGLGTTYYNTAVGSAQSLFSTSVSDSSNNSYGLNPDANFNAVPDDANEDIPTPLTIGTWGILSFKLIDFTASQKGKSALLNCSLLNADNTITITLQRSSDNSNFDNIANTEAAPASRIVQYQWADNNAARDRPNYYRLKFLKQDGTYFYSGIMKVVLAHTELEILVNPNPFTNAVSFEVKLNGQQKINYKLVNLLGKTVYNNEKSGQAGVNRITLEELSAIPPGVYLLQVTTDDDTYFKKIVKSNQ